jgi:uncharacterized protein YneF (UPF0154 family)
MQIGYNLEWWQTFLIILGCVAVFIPSGFFLGKFVMRKEMRKLIKNNNKAMLTAKNNNDAMIVKEENKPTPSYFDEVTTFRKQLKSEEIGLFAEVEINFRIATKPGLGKLLPFQTTVWDNNPNDIFRLPQNLQEDLTEAYVDMRLANNIFWLAMNLGHISSNLQNNYIDLCTKIATRLRNMMSLKGN